MGNNWQEAASTLWTMVFTNDGMIHSLQTMFGSFPLNFDMTPRQIHVFCPMYLYIRNYVNLSLNHNIQTHEDAIWKRLSLSCLIFIIIYFFINFQLYFTINYVDIFLSTLFYLTMGYNLSLIIIPLGLGA